MSKDAEYTKIYKEKRKTKRLVFDFYIDDIEEQEVYNYLQSQSNKKQFLLNLVKKDMDNA